MSGACACDCMPFVCVHGRPISRHVPSARGVVHLGGGGGAETLALGNDRQYGGLTLDLYFADLVRACMRYVLCEISFGRALDINILSSVFVCVTNDV